MKRKASDNKLRKYDEHCWKIFKRKAGRHKLKNRLSRAQLKHKLLKEVRNEKYI